MVDGEKLFESDLKALLALVMIHSKQRTEDFITGTGIKIKE